jgi:hypothetical protein
MAALLALCSSVAWGIADFAGGVLVRRHRVATISALSHSTTLVVLGVVAAIVGLDGTGFLIGVAAGGFGAISLYTFYKAMSLGTMSVVSPLLSLGSAGRSLRRSRSASTSTCSPARPRRVGRSLPSSAPARPRRCSSSRSRSRCGHRCESVFARSGPSRRSASRRPGRSSSSAMRPGSA